MYSDVVTVSALSSLAFFFVSWMFDAYTIRAFLLAKFAPFMLAVSNLLVAIKFSGLLY